MPDSFLGLFRFHRFMAGRPGRHEAMKLFRSALDQPEIEVAEANQPIAAVGLRDPDQFPDQRFTDENQVTAPFDLAARTPPANRMVCVIPKLFELCRVTPRRSTTAAPPPRPARGVLR